MGRPPVTTCRQQAVRQLSFQHRIGVRAPRLRVALHHVRVTRQFLIDSKPARGVVHERVEPEHAAHERGQCIPHRIRPPQMHAFVRENERLLHLRVAHLEIGGQDEARPEHPDHRRTARGLLRAERATLLEQRAEASQVSALQTNQVREKRKRADSPGRCRPRTPVD